MTINICVAIIAIAKISRGWHTGLCQTLAATYPASRTSLEDSEILQRISIHTPPRGVSNVVQDERNPPWCHHYTEIHSRILERRKRSKLHHRSFCLTTIGKAIWRWRKAGTRFALTVTWHMVRPIRGCSRTETRKYCPTVQRYTAEHDQVVKEHCRI